MTVSEVALRTTLGARAAHRPTAPPPSSPAVVVNDFSFFYGPRLALKDLNFAIERKAVTAIIGSFAAEHLPTGPRASAVPAEGPVNGTASSPASSPANGTGR